LLSISVCGYKQEPFIRASVAAALSQTYSPLEVILSDDCSPDRTFEIMTEMAKSYRGPHRVVLNRNPSNYGLGKHVNRVVELVKGRLLVVSAGDDISTPERVETVFLAWEQSGRSARVIQCGTIDIDEEGKRLGGQSEAVTTSPSSASEEVRPSLFDYVRTLKPGIFGCALAYDPELFRIFGPLPEELIHEDNAIALRGLFFGPLLFVKAPLLQRRIHANNIFSRFHGRVATREAVAQQEARTARDAHNRVVLYESFRKDLLVARDRGLLDLEQWQRLDDECLRCRRLFSYQQEHGTASVPRKLQLLVGACRDRADKRLIKWMLPRLLPRGLFQWSKATVNSVRLGKASQAGSRPPTTWT